ncbi:MAG: site-specific integrase, partial [Thermoplasmata archaeon]|nr:site-specific integrase [Thermoplasmata archaeon]
SHLELIDPVGKTGGAGPPPPVPGLVEPQPIQNNGEPTMPQGERRWCEYWTTKYVGTRTRATSEWRRNTQRLLNHLVAEGHRGRSRNRGVLATFLRAGVDPVPLSPMEVTRDQATRLREFAVGEFTPQTARGLLGETRRFLRWAGNQVADDDALWATAEGEAGHRRWATLEDIAGMLRVASPRESAVVALLGLCGMRGVEAFRLLVRNVRVDGPEPALLVLGKGPHGGKWRPLPLPALAWLYLKPYVEGKAPGERVLPVALVTIQKDVVSVARRAGLRLSAHDLRRGFGRAFWESNGRSWDAVLALQKWYGHSRPETTIGYLGIRFDEMKAGLRPMEEKLRELLATELADLPQPQPEESR